MSKQTIRAGQYAGLTGDHACEPDYVSLGSGIWRPTDLTSLIAIRDRVIVVDTQTGAITNVDGERVECLAPGASGRVRVQRFPRAVWAPAHRIVWLAAHGHVPYRACVRHHNGHRWDNRLINLYLSRQRGCVTYPEVGREAVRDER